MIPKTLEDFTLFSRIKDDGRATLLVDSFDLKNEIIRWIKEDRGSIESDKKMPQPVKMLLNYLTTKWMRRFNITEDDLK